jgi:hypothetical protein
VGRKQGLSKIIKIGDGRTSDGRRRRRSSGAAITGKVDKTLSHDKRSMKTQPFVGEDRITAARQRISDGYYDRDEVRRVIAEALVFVLGARRD